MYFYLLNNKYFYICCISLNIACKLKCYISKSKLVLSECNDLYFIAIALIAFTSHQIKVPEMEFLPFWGRFQMTTSMIQTDPNHPKQLFPAVSAVKNQLV